MLIIALKVKREDQNTVFLYASALAELVMQKWSPEIYATCNLHVYLLL